VASSQVASSSTRPGSTGAGSTVAGVPAASAATGEGAGAASGVGGADAALSSGRGAAAGGGAGAAQADSATNAISASSGDERTARSIRAGSPRVPHVGIAVYRGECGGRPGTPARGVAAMSRLEYPSPAVSTCGNGSASRRLALFVRKPDLTDLEWEEQRT
jgi:hypothetical protein